MDISFKTITPPRKNRAISSFVGSILDEIPLPTNINLNKRVRNEDVFDLIYYILDEKLTIAGFNNIDSGGYKNVFYNNKFPDFVVKLYNSSNGYSEDSNVSKLPKFLQPFFLNYVERNVFYLIQPKANNKRGKWRIHPEYALQSLLTPKQYDIASNMDVRDENVMFHDGNPVIIDFCF